MTAFGPPGRGDRVARRLLLPLTLVLILLVLIFWVLFTSLQVSGDSMYPTLGHGDRVLVSRGYGTPERGDIVHVDARELEGARGDQVIKRVVALAGDTISIENGRALVNGVPEDPVNDLILDDNDVSIPSLTIPEGYVYVLGDNRPVSLDSRFYGPVPVGAIEGRIIFCYTPVTRFGPIDRGRGPL